MEKSRIAREELMAWKNSRNRKVLMLTGTYGVGKRRILHTFAERRFGKAYFIDLNVVDCYLYLDSTLTGGQVLERLGIPFSDDVQPRNTLIVLENLHFHPDMVEVICRIHQEFPEYAIAGVGNLLESLFFGISGSFRDQFYWIRVCPLTFKEYLGFRDYRLVASLNSLQGVVSIDDEKKKNLLRDYTDYLVGGGYPDVVEREMQNGCRMEAGVDDVLGMVADGILQDIQELAPERLKARIVELWTEIPRQLLKDNQKFNYSYMRKGARSRDYETALDWLVTVGLVNKVVCNKKAFVPLSDYDESGSYKLFLQDAGMLRFLSGVPVAGYRLDHPMMKMLSEAMVETIILQSMLCAKKFKPRYWLSLGKAELPFIVEVGDSIYPIEVRTGEKLGGRSLQVYDLIFSPKLLIRFSMNKLELTGRLLNIPLYMADWAHVLIVMSRAARV